jgi:hypothetical protein
MSEENQVAVENEDYLEMSDEEIMGMASPPEPKPQVEPEPVEDEDEDEEVPEEDEEDYEEDEEVDDESDDEEEEEEVDDEVDEDEEESTDDTTFDKPEKTSDNTSTKEKPSKEESSSKVNYKQVYDEIFKPFRANGKEIKVQSTQEVIQLMQMGANYNKKMAGIKDQLPYLKMLEKNDLLDETKLSYAVDLLSGDKAAIARLIKDNELDLYDLDDDASDSYEPTYKGVSKQEIEVSQTIEDLRESPSFDRTMEIATSKWDNASQTFIVNNPGILRILDEHISHGIYDTVQAEVERLEGIGELAGLNSLEAYKVVGDMLSEQGAFGKANQSTTQTNDAKEQKRKEINRKKKATGQPKSTVRSKRSKEVINPLSLSDEDFLKQGMDHLM